jgi:hypothetical protein
LLFGGFDALLVHEVVAFVAGETGSGVEVPGLALVRDGDALLAVEEVSLGAFEAEISC